MKILELRFKNLNSLQGEWHIDFTDESYQIHGIFALTGPTGAGKSTILDAICLALYGQTPRLGSITKTDNEIMSRHTSECYAEVRFLSQAGEFLCRFDQRRARKSVTGALQDPRHEISDEKGNILESKRSKVPAVVEEKTGMDFKRFTRSILLAQGQFDGFLKASCDEKSKILEQLTGTEIYAEISKGVFNRMREEERIFARLAASVDAVQLLSPEDEAHLQAEIHACEHDDATLKAEIIRTQAAIDWQQEHQALTANIEALQAEALRISAQAAAFEPKQTRLNQALKAATLEDKLEHLRQLRKEHDLDAQDLQQQTEALPLHQAAVQQHQQKIQATAAALAAWQSSRADKEALWDQVQALDLAMDVLEGQMVSTNAKKTDEERAVADLTAKIVDMTENIDQINHQCEAWRAHLEAHPEDAALVEILPHIGTLYDRLEDHDQKRIALAQAHAEQTAARNELQAQLSNHIKVIEEKKSDKTAAASQVTMAQAALETLQNGQTLKDYQREKEHWLREQSFHAAIHNYEAARARLKRDEPCPLCGSITHPFVTEALPMNEAEQHIIRITQIMDDIEVAAAAVKQAEKQLQSINGDLQKAEAELKMLELEVMHAQKDMDKSAAELEVLEQTWADDVELWQVKTGPFVQNDTDRKAILRQLNARKGDWCTAKTTLNDAAEKLQALQAELSVLMSQKTVHVERLIEFERTLTTWQGQQDEKLSMRQNLFGDADVALEKSKWHAALTAHQTMLDAAKDEHQQAQAALMRLEARMMDLTQRMQAHALKLTALNDDLSTACNALGFASEDAVMAAMLPKAERLALQAQSEALNDQAKENHTRLVDAEARLTEMMAHKCTTESMDALQAMLKAQQSKMDEINQKLGSLQATLKRNADAKATMAEAQAAIDEQRKILAQWQALNHLIGSADGKKYRTFAQGLTFELMVRQANQELMKMSDRYLLVRDEKEALQLNVIDNYQAGEVRSTKNLSGGESFIVSLALALGLSKMASQTVRVDSLFLDEGFGTLDEDALDTALSLLAGLHGEGKLIGIISHVSALKERITTQIQIQPKNGGKSIIIGPGCTKLDSSLMS